MDNFSAPRFDLLFRPQEYTPNPNEDANFIANIGALQDPSGTLARKQAELVAKNMAQVKTDDIRGEFQKFALDEMQRNLDDELGMYKSNKGFNRLSLNADQLLTKQKRDKELVGKVGALRQLSNDYQSTMEEVGKDVAKGIITPEDYDAFDADLKNRIKTAGGIADIPSARSVYNTYLSKYASQDWLKKLDELMKVPMEQGSKRSTDVIDPKTGKYVSVFDYDGVTDAMPLVELYPQIQRGLEIRFGNDQQAIQKFLGDRYGLKGQKLVAGQMSNHVTVNNGDGRGGKKGKYALPFTDVTTKYKLKTNFKENNYAVKEMNLESEATATPWMGNIKIADGTEKNVTGKITRLIMDNQGGVYARIVGVGVDDFGTRDAENIVQDVPVTSDMLKSLQDNGIDVTQIRQVWGKNIKTGSSGKPKLDF